MKINKIIGRLALLVSVLALYSCAEDKFYDLGGNIYGGVAFSAINLNTPEINEAESTTEDYYYYLPNRDSSFDLIAYDAYLDENGEMPYRDYRFNLSRESEIWSGGYNDIKITFKPTEPEETEAVFTMPDGSTYTATAENPTIIWTPDSTHSGNSLSESNYIKAESNYTKGKTNYLNRGYIYVSLNPDFRYNKMTEKWYISPWTNGQSMEIKTYTKFTAENLVIEGDNCTSYNSNFRYTIESRNDMFTLPYYDYDDETPLRFVFSLGGNEIFVTGGQKILFTFHPAEGEEAMTLDFPTGESVTLTRSNPTYTWDLSIDNAIELDGSRYIGAHSTYTYQGIRYHGYSEIKLMTTTQIGYNPVSGRYYRL